MDGLNTSNDEPPSGRTVRCPIYGKYRRHRLYNQNTKWGPPHFKVSPGEARFDLEHIVQHSACCVLGYSSVREASLTRCMQGKRELARRAILPVRSSTKPNWKKNKKRLLAPGSFKLLRLSRKASETILLTLQKMPFGCVLGPNPSGKRTSACTPANAKNARQNEIGHRERLLRVAA